MTGDIQCPYCESWQEIDHSDGYGYEEDKMYEQQCADCEKNFVYTTYIIYGYEEQKADCLNDAEHDYKPTCTYPKIATQMECSMCGERRKPTEKEMESILNQSE